MQIPADERHLISWLDAGYHGEMHYMQRHGLKRSRPEELVPGTVRVISVRMDYWPAEARAAQSVLDDPQLAYVSRYALGRDYHKVLRGLLAQLAGQAARRLGPFGYRVCVDCAPVLESALARDAGLGWIGKHTNLIARDAGSWFFLGEILTDLPLPPDAPASAHCGSCSACIPACPTAAIVAPYRLDARRCISYLTIEHHGAIPLELRPAIGNRIYGCDDCQLVCPWNKFAHAAAHPDFKVRHGARCSIPAGPVPLERVAVRGAHARLGDLPHRLRALVAQHRGGARQCTALGAGAERAARTRAGRFRAGARTCALGARRAGRQGPRRARCGCCR